MNASPIMAGSTATAQTWPLAATAGPAIVEPLPELTASPTDPVEAAGTTMLASADTPATTLAPTDTATAAPRTAATAFAAGLPVATTASTQAAPASFGTPQTGAGMVGTTVVTLLLVIGFILLLGWLAKRMPGIGGANNPALKVVGSLALGPRDRVVVVAVGDTQLLLATGPGGTRTLHTLEQPLPMPANTPSPFAQVLAQQFGKKRP